MDTEYRNCNNTKGERNEENNNTKHGIKKSDSKEEEDAENMESKDEEYTKGAEEITKTNVTLSSPYMCCSEQRIYM